MLRNEMPRTGQWLFVHRTFVPFLALPVIALVMAEPRVSACVSRYAPLDFPGRWQYVWEGSCLAIAAAGVLLRTVAVGYAARNTSGRNTREGQRADALNTTGLYSLVRNPLYLGNLFITLGVLLTVRSWELIAIVFLAFLLYYERIITAEEAFLEGKFGEEYRAWASATPCLRPRLRGWRSPPDRFSWRQAIRGEYQSVFGVVVAMFAIRLARDCLEGRPFEVDRVHGIVFAAAAAMYVVVRTIKKRTRLLEPR